MNQDQQKMTIKFSSASELDYLLNGFFKNLLLYSEKCMFDFFKYVTSILQENRTELLNIRKEQHEELCVNNLILSFFPRKSLNSKTYQRRENIFSLMRFDGSISKFLIVDHFKNQNGNDVRTTPNAGLIRTESEVVTQNSQSLSREPLSALRRKHSGSMSGSLHNLSFDQSRCLDRQIGTRGSRPKCPI